MDTITSFRDQASYDIFRDATSKKARKRLPVELWDKAQKIMNALNNANEPGDLQRYDLKLLSGDRVGQYSLRINDQYRICFEWTDGTARLVEVTDYHD